MRKPIAANEAASYSAKRTSIYGLSKPPPAQMKKTPGRDRRLNNHRHFLREWRIYRGLTQDELASRIGTSSGAIAAWETVDRGIRLQDQFRLFAALRIRPAQFFQRPS